MKECVYSKYCGGCNNLNILYDTQLINKAKYVTEVLNSVGIQYKIPKTFGMFFPYAYRNKVHLAFKEFKGKTIVGFYEEGSSKIVDIDSCLLHDKWLTKLIEILKKFVKKYRITPYDTITKTGTIRYAVARCIDNKIMLTLVTTTKNFAGREYLYACLQDIFKEVSLYININKRTDKLVFDDRGFDFVKGSRYIKSTINGVKYSIAPNSFLQVNMEICKAMYAKANNWLEINKNDVVLDLYGGIGITSILFAKNCKNVVSIEYNAEATKMASINVKSNNIDNIKVLTGPCGEVIKKLDITVFNKAFLDPARMGAEKETLQAIMDSNIETVVYMSCDPTTLARDLKVLLNKYQIDEFETYDMFPQTNHVECLVKLTRMK